MNSTGRAGAPTGSDDGPTVSPSRVVRTALLVFLGVLLLTGVPSLLAARTIRSERLAAIEADERGDVRVAITLLDKELFEIAADLSVARSSPAVVEFALDPTAASHRQAGAYMSRVALAYGRYPVIQLLDARGRERLRVDHADSATRIVPLGEREDLSGQPFVQAALELRADDLHLSGIEPERDRIDAGQPSRAVMRLATPVIDPSGGHAGLLLFTYDATDLLNDLFGAFDHALDGHETIFLQGDMMFHHPEPGAGWGDVFAPGETRSISATYPEIATLIAEQDESRALTGQGLFVWSTSRPLSYPAGRLTRVDSDLAWTLLTHVDVPTLRQTRPLWKNPWLVAVVALVLLLLLSLSFAIALATERLRAARRRAEQDAMTDALTGAGNRRAFQDAILQEIARNERYGATFTLALLDVDHFKTVNDTYGHDAGDQVLRRIVSTSRSVLRGSDTLFRIGGEEFAVLLPNTPLSDAESVLERIRTALDTERFSFAGDQTIELTVSIGVTASANGLHTANMMQTTADEALYQAKRQGRNRLVRIALDDSLED